jgi:predicted O-methyltransferase YrrM
MEKLKKLHTNLLKKFSLQKNENRRLWNVGNETAELLSLIVMIHKPKIVLELGTSNGYSTFHLALSKESKIITIDVEKSRNELAINNLQEFQNIEFITDRIENYIPKINYTIDMLFIDSNKNNYLNYLVSLEKHFRNGTVIIADNIDSHLTTKQYQNFIKKSIKYKTIHLSIEDGVLISIFND